MEANLTESEEFVFKKNESVVFRAARMLKIPENKSVAEAFKEGATFLHAAPFSSSKKLMIAKEFGDSSKDKADPAEHKDTLFIIHVKELAYTADITNNSYYPREAEVLWYPYTGFKVEKFMSYEDELLDGVWKYVIIMSTLDTHKVCKKGTITIGTWASTGLNPDGIRAVPDKELKMKKQNPNLWFK